MIQVASACDFFTKAEPGIPGRTHAGHASISLLHSPESHQDLRRQTRPCSFRSSSKGHSLQIRTMIEMGVVAQQWEPAFADKCGDPEVIGRDGSAV